MNKVIILLQGLILLGMYLMYQESMVQREALILLDKRTSGISVVLQKEIQQCIDFSRVVE